MIEIVATIDTSKLHAWLEASIKPRLTLDPSSYTSGRYRAWLRSEPMLVKPFDIKPGLPVSNAAWNRLSELIGWRFDYCLITYSGDITAAGIKPHRDAGYADYEAYGLNVNGHCTFRYWQGRNSFGYSKNEREYDTAIDAPTQVLELKPGDVIRFNCKNKHEAIPDLRRWNMNFWRKKPERKKTPDLFDTIRGLTYLSSVPD